MNKVQLSKAAALLRKDPTLLAKVNALAAGIKADRKAELRKRNTPDRRVIEALTHEQLAEKCETSPTSMSRFLSRHKIAGDVVVGNRIAYSKQLAAKIADAVYWNGNALWASWGADAMRESSPAEAEELARLQKEHASRRDAVIASLPKF